MAIFLIDGGVAAVLAHLDRFHPHSAVRVGLDHLAHLIEDEPGDLLAADRRHDAQVHQTQLGHVLEGAELRIVGGDQYRVVEHLVQPGAHFLEVAEVEAPVVLVQTVGGEDEAESQLGPMLIRATLEWL